MKTRYALQSENISFEFTHERQAVYGNFFASLKYSTRKETLAPSGCGIPTRSHHPRNGSESLNLSKFNFWITMYCNAVFILKVTRSGSMLIPHPGVADSPPGQSGTGHCTRDFIQMKREHYGLSYPRIMCPLTSLYSSNYSRSPAGHELNDN